MIKSFLSFSFYQTKEKMYTYEIFLKIVSISCHQFFLHEVYFISIYILFEWKINFRYQNFEKRWYFYVFLVCWSIFIHHIIRNEKYWELSIFLVFELKLFQNIHRISLNNMGHLTWKSVETFAQEIFRYLITVIYLILYNKIQTYVQVRWFFHSREK